MRGCDVVGRMFEVEEVSGRVLFRHFVELPHLLLRDEPRWSAPVASWDRVRLDPNHNPYFERGDGAYFLLRRLGRPAGRITAQLAADGDEAGWFGFYDVVDDVRGAPALVDAAAEWLAERGCTTMTGPACFTVDDEAGVLIDGYGVPGTTGRPWHPPWYADGLVAAGLTEVTGSARATWRLPAEGPATAAVGPSGEVAAPKLAGPYADRRLVLGGPAGTIAAVPDLTIAHGSAWQLGKRAKRGDWDGCTVVHCNGDPSVLVPAVQAAAAEAGYSWVVAPWAPPPAPKPETTHALFTRAL